MTHVPDDPVSSRASASITLDQWIALNDELLALVRAGVPLDRGLINAGREMRRGVASGLVVRLGERLAQGRSLDEALADEGQGLPALYRAVVAAGVRSGRLAQALEGMATFGRGVADTRRAIGLALFYPLIVMSMAYGVFVAFVLLIYPRFVDAFEAFRLKVPRSFRILEWLHGTASYWIPIIPLMLLGFAVIWTLSNQASRLRPGRLFGVLRLVPGLGSIISNAQAATVSEVLALLVDQGIPMPEALHLAADASGDAALISEASAMADAIGRGESPSADFYLRKGAFPPLLRWIVVSGQNRFDLPGAMRHAGRTYRSRATRTAESIQSILPASMLLLFGALTVFLYALTVFGPMASLWYQLGAPIGWDS